MVDAGANVGWYTMLSLSLGCAVVAFALVCILCWSCSHCRSYSCRTPSIAAARASAPEDLVQGVINACGERFDVSLDKIETARETVTFKLPRILSEPV